MRKPNKTSMQVLTKIFRLVYEDGMPVRDVAYAFNLSTNYCHRLLSGESRTKVTGPLIDKYRENKEINIRRPPRAVPSRIELLKVMKKTGSQKLTAEYLDCHRSVVQRWVARHEIKKSEYMTEHLHSSHHRLEEGDIPLIRELGETMKPAVVADKFDVSVQTIYNVLRGRSWSWVK